MDVQEAQREMRSVYVGGFWGQLVASVIWLVSATLGAWVSPRASILTVVIGGFFIFPFTQMLLRLSHRRASVSPANPFASLGMQVAFVLPFSMLLLVPVGLYRLDWFFPALMILIGAHYLPFATLYGMRMFLLLAGILISTGVVIALYSRKRSVWAPGSAERPCSFSPGLGALLRRAKQAHIADRPHRISLFIRPIGNDIVASPAFHLEAVSTLETTSAAAPHFASPLGAEASVGSGR